MNCNEPIYYPGDPGCPVLAEIPARSVDNPINLKGLRNCFVHVKSTNQTFYIDDQYHQILTWAGPIFQDDYDFQANPFKVFGTTVYDFKNLIAGVYDYQGRLRQFSLLNTSL